MILAIIYRRCCIKMELDERVTNQCAICNARVWPPVPGTASARAPARPRALGTADPRAQSSRKRRDTVSVPVPAHVLACRRGRARVFRSVPGPAGPRERSSPQRQDTVWVPAPPPARRDRHEPARVQLPVYAWWPVPLRARRPVVVPDAVPDAVSAVERAQVQALPLKRKKYYYYLFIYYYLLLLKILFADASKQLLNNCCVRR